MGPPAAAAPGALGLGSPLPTTAVLLLLLFLLAKGGPSAEGCLNCGQQFKNLRMRFAQLCARYREHFHRENCSNYPWGGEAVRDFALDEAALDLLLEKAHRVLRVIEIKQSFADVPKFWKWLHSAKIPAETQEALCPPACQVVASLFNCSTCRRVEIPCWDLKTCYPGEWDLKTCYPAALLCPTEYPGLPKVIQLLLCISGACFFMGLVSCALEFWLRPGLGTK
ncbi:sperm-egg fusion protein TMEM95 [Candoia aspera]|uniref:sperm-egg fusion protein TMEM95 n=1 Tax=Candoia aspera TaxID=51853 RepID=UPI002FD8291D